MFSNLKKCLKKLPYRVLVHSAYQPPYMGDEFGIFLEQIRQEGFCSQYGQDKWIAEKLLPGLKHGVFCDIGAHDGVTLSNTCYFEKKLGWTGIAFEPMPQVFKQLRANRSCEAINGCVGPEAGRAEFMVLSGYTEMLSGLVAHYHPDHLKRIDNELVEHGGGIEKIEVQTFRLNEVLEQYGINHVDYMNIDVEGAEYPILKSIDFDRLNFTVIGIENNYQDFRIPLFMKRKGYVLNAVVGDEIYVKKDHRLKGRIL